jgi:hypothetical protein
MIFLNNIIYNKFLCAKIYFKPNINLIFNMKRVFQILAVASVLFIFACKGGSADVAGTWTFDEFQLDDSKMTDEQKKSMAMMKPMMAGMFKDAKCVFNADGTCEMTVGGQSDKATFTNANGKIAVKGPAGQDDINMEMKDGKLHMKIDKDEMHMSIIFKK